MKKERKEREKKETRKKGRKRKTKRKATVCNLCNGGNFEAGAGMGELPHWDGQGGTLIQNYYGGAELTMGESGLFLAEPWLGMYCVL